MIGWLPPPDPLFLQDDRVHVWAVELDDETFDYRRGDNLLSADERTRAGRFKFARDRRRYVIAHAALRNILARYLKTEGSDLQFVEVGNGKPTLGGTFAASRLGFNLSHSNEVALFALSRARAVGVDIEFVKADFVFNDVAGRFFTAKEVAALRDLPVHLQRLAFYKCWTSKEAFLKAKGTGLSGNLDEMEIVWDGDERMQIRANVPGWSLAELSPGNGYAASIVTEGDPLLVNCYRWRPPSVT